MIERARDLDSRAQLTRDVSSLISDVWRFAIQEEAASVPKIKVSIDTEVPKLRILDNPKDYFALITQESNLLITFDPSRPLNLEETLKRHEPKIEGTINDLRNQLLDTLMLAEVHIYSEPQLTTAEDLTTVLLHNDYTRRMLDEHQRKLIVETNYLIGLGAQSISGPHSPVLELNRAKGFTVLARAASNGGMPWYFDFNLGGLRIDNFGGLGPIHSMEGPMSNVIRSAIVQCVRERLLGPR